MMENFYNMGKRGRCPICQKIVIEDLEDYKEKYPDEKEIMCPYCGGMVKLR